MIVLSRCDEYDSFVGFKVVGGECVDGGRTFRRVIQGTSHEFMLTIAMIKGYVYGNQVCFLYALSRWTYGRSRGFDESRRAKGMAPAARIHIREPDLQSLRWSSCREQ